MIKYRLNQKFSNVFSQLLLPFTVSPNQIDIQNFSTSFTQVSGGIHTISISQGYKDSSSYKYQLRIEPSDNWIVPQDEFATTEDVDINNRSTIELPIKILGDSIGFGKRNGSIRIRLYKVPIGNSLQQLRRLPVEEVSVPIGVLVLSRDEVYAPNINISHLQGSQLPTVDYKILASGEFNLQLPNALSAVSSYITNSLVTTDYTVYTISSSSSLRIRLNEEVAGLFDYPIHLYTNTNDSSATCNVNVEEEIGYKVTPAELNFKAVIDYEEAMPITVDLQGVGHFTLDVPVWLNATKISGNKSTSIDFIPWNSSNFGPSVQRGFINIVMGSVVHKRIAVTYKVIKGIDFNLREWRMVNFIEDNNATTLYASNEAVSALEFRAFERGHSIGNTVEKAHFKNKVAFNIGQHIKQMIQVPPVELESAEYFYRNIFVCDVTATSIDREERAVNYEEFHNTGFWKGHTPAQYNDEVGILKRKTQLQRVYHGSYIILNLISSKRSAFVEIYRNNVLVSHRSISSSVDLFGLKDKIIGTPGDIIDYRVKYGHPADGLFFQSSYVVFPNVLPVYNVNHLLFYGEYDVLESYAIGGRTTLNIEGEGIDVERTKDFKKEIMRLDNEMNHSLEINTGHTLMQDKDIVYEIMNSKKVWLHTANGDYIPIVPQNFEESTSSDDALYTADLEFKINTHDIQNYTL